MLTPKQLREITAAAKALTSSQAARTYMRGATRNRAIKALEKARRTPVNRLLNSVTKELGQADFTEQVLRYARGGGGTLFNNVIKRLGPVGNALAGLLRGKELPASTPTNVIEDAIKLLEANGFEVRRPGASGGPPPIPPPIIPRQQPPPLPPGRRSGPPPLPPGRSRPQVPAGPGATSTGPPGGRGGSNGGNQPPTGTFPRGEGIVMELVEGSSNVYAIGYNATTKTMRVQYLGAALNRHAITGSGHTGRNRARGRLGALHARAPRSGPGSTYDYFNVPQGIYDRISRAGSKGTAIWDNLRIRGTVYGHQYSYVLSAAARYDVIYTNGRPPGRITYVPRRAVGPGVFEGRTIRQGSGRTAQTFRSLLPDQR